MARLLIFDTAGAACSVALWADDSVAAERYEAMARGQAERLLPMIGEALAAAGISYAQLDGIGVTCGPGAFTGLRIGLAAARGLALTLGIPAIGITTFEALAVRAPAGCVVAIDTKRNDYYCQRFGPDGAAQGEPGILSPADAVALADSRNVAPCHRQIGAAGRRIRRRCGWIAGRSATGRGFRIAGRRPISRSRRRWPAHAAAALPSGAGSALAGSADCGPVSITPGVLAAASGPIGWRPAA